MPAVRSDLRVIEGDPTQPEQPTSWAEATAGEDAAGRVVILDARDEIDPEQIERDEGP